ncbi:MAG: TraB/GumN family protein [Longimicrobiales bacterium]|nr:TraB/GumN family protein [Longimicrobiales bacterium]
MTHHTRTSRIAALLVASATMIAGAPHPLAFEAAEGPPLWRVGDDDTTIFLFGLPNLMDGETQWRTTAFDAALSQADVVILEADRSSPEARMAMQQAAQELGIFGDGLTLHDVVGDDLWARTQALAATLGLPPRALNPLRPWLAANQLQGVALQQAGLVGAESPTAVISAEAASAGTPVTWLEASTTLLHAMGDLPEASQVRIFRQAIDVLEHDPEAPARTLAQWAAGDVDALAATFHGEGEWADEVVRTAVLLERNATWQAQLEEVLTTETGVYFVAVGIGHLVGDDSLVAALEAAGYPVERR